MSKRCQDPERVRSIPTDRGMILPAYAGVAFLLSWIYLLFYANSAGIEAAAPISLMGIPYTLSSGIMAIVILIIAFAPPQFADRIMTGKMKVTSAVGTSVGTLFMICAVPLELIWLMLVGSAVTGLFSGLLAQQWVIAYRRVGLRVMISSFPALLAVSTGICMTLMYLPREVVMIATILLPIVSGFMLHSVRNALFPEFDLGAPVKDRPLDFAIVLFPVGIFAFSTGFLDFYSYESSYTYIFYVSVTVILLIAACVFVLITNRENAFVCIVIPLCFFVCIFVPFVTMLDHVPASHFVSIGELGIEIALFSVAIGFADFFSISALKTYALIRVVHVILNAVGWYAGSFANLALDDMMSSQASLAVVFIGVEVVAVCLIVAVVKAQKTTDSADRTKVGISLGSEGAQLGESVEVSPGSEEIASASQPTTPLDPSDSSAPSPSSATSASAAEAQTLDSRCLVLGHEYGLSNREMDVFTLLARGYSAVAIQGELYIAPGTVNYHTRNIYSKLGVHSKQELIKLVSDF